MKFIVAALIVVLAAVSANAQSYGHKTQSYGGHSSYHQAPVHPVKVQTHTYHSPGPQVKCGQNLLVGCAPQVAHVPCVPSKHGYGGHGGYGGHSAGYSAPAPSYHAPAKGGYEQKKY